MYKEKLRELLTNGESQVSLSKKIGISGATLSQYLTGKYPTPQAIEPKFIEFFLMAETVYEIAVKRPDFVPTTITDTVIQTIGYCHVQKAMGIVYGDAGVGKTMAINRYEADHTEAIIITSAYALAKPMSFLKAIARKLRIAEGRRQDDLYTEIIDKLRGSEKILIIDEAQHLPHSSLEIIRGIHDDANIPIVLVGNHEVYSKLLGRGEAAFAQLFSRIAIRKNLLTSHVKYSDVERLFNRPELGKTELNFLHDVSCTKWGIRGAMYVFMNSANNGDLSLEGLKKMTKYMGIGN